MIGQLPFRIELVIPRRARVAVRLVIDVRLNVVVVAVGVEKVVVVEIGVDVGGVFDEQVLPIVGQLGVAARRLKPVKHSGIARSGSLRQVPRPRRLAPEHPGPQLPDERHLAAEVPSRVCHRDLVSAEELELNQPLEEQNADDDDEDFGHPDGGVPRARRVEDV